MPDSFSTSQFASAYEQHLPAVSRYLARRVEKQHVEDLAADVFALAWSKRGDVMPGEELPWLYRISANLVANHRRREASAKSFFAGLRPVDSAPAAEDIVVADRALAEAWGKLRAREREILALAIVEDLSVPTIAAVLDVSKNAASIRLHRARAALASALR